MSADFPKNMVVVTAMMKVGEVEYSTTINVQTHKLEEIQYATERAWKATRQEAKNAVTTVRVTE